MKLTPELKEIALRIFDEICQPVDDVDCVERWNIEYFAKRFLAALPNSEPAPEYTREIGEAAERYFDSFGSDFNVRTPATFRYAKLWDAMTAAAYTAPPIPQDYKAQLAKSQAREAKLNSVLCEIAASKSLTATPTQFYQHLQRIASNATFESFVSTALNELIAKAGEVMRERCFQTAQPEDSFQDEWFAAKADSSARIRALPGVALEDLNHD